MKTPEELADEHVEKLWQDTGTKFERICCQQDFLAGYKAAKDQVADVDKVMNSSNNSNGWISVKDRLPEEDIAVLVYGQVLNDPPDVIGVRRRYNGDQEWKHTWESEDGFIYREDDVTHWMPLPPAPKEEANGE